MFIGRNEASARLHKIKHEAGHRGDVIFDRSGGVYDPHSREFLGSLTEGGGKLDEDEDA